MTTTTNDARASAKIEAIRQNAGADMSRCPTCTHAPDAPYRYQDGRGVIIYGCVDACHTGKVFGASAEWHNRKQAQELRRATLAHLQTL